MSRIKPLLQAFVLCLIVASISGQIDDTCSAQAKLRVAGESQASSVFARENLVAWCIVPFDGKKRGPAERAAMCAKLGLKKVAYDWRNEHVPTFEEEILEYRKHGIEYFAFWGGHEEAYKLFKKYDLHPQIWRTLGSPEAANQRPV